LIACYLLDFVTITSTLLKILIENKQPFQTKSTSQKSKLNCPLWTGIIIIIITIPENHHTIDFN